MALHWGFKLTEIIPFEDRILSHYGYDRKRTYADDIFPSSSSSSSSSSSTSSSSSQSASTLPSTRSLAATASSTAQPIVPHSLTAKPLLDTATLPDKSYTADSNDNKYHVRKPSQELSLMQKKYWERNSVTAWTLVFSHTS